MYETASPPRERSRKKSHGLDVNLICTVKTRFEHCQVVGALGPQGQGMLLAEPPSNRGRRPRKRQSHIELASDLFFEGRLIVGIGKAGGLEGDVRDLFQGISQECGFADPAPPVKDEQSGGRGSTLSGGLRVLADDL